MLTHLSRVRLFATLWTVALQAPLPMGFSRQEYWTGCHFLLQDIFLTQGSNLQLLHCRWMLNHWATREALKNVSAAAAAASLQSCPTLCDPIDSSPPGSPVLGILQARTLEWVAISFSNAWRWKVKVKSLSHVRLSATPCTAAHQAPPSMGLSRQEYWSGVPLPSPKKNVSRHCQMSWGCGREGSKNCSWLRTSTLDKQLSLKPHPALPQSIQ